MIEPHVVFVDDDRALRESLQRALRKEPYRLITVASARECLDVLSAAPIRVVVCDQMMPGITGLDLLAHLRVSRPEIVRIVLSGNVTRDTAIDAINDCEVFRLLSKPCATAELAMAVRAALRHHDLITQSKRLLDLIHMQAAYIKNTSGVMEPFSASKAPVHSDSYDLERLIGDATREVERLESLLRARSN